MAYFTKRGERSGELISVSLTVKEIREKPGQYPVYGGNGVTGFFEEFNLEGEHIIIGRVGALCGNVRNVEGKLWVTDNAFYINSYKKNIDKKFLTLLLRYLNLGSYANKAAQPVISYKSIKNIWLPIPSSIEQKRLVEKLDSLLSRIDTAIIHLQHSLKLNDQLFSSNLNQAFNPLNSEAQPNGTYQLPEGWEWHVIDDVTQIGAKRGFVPDVDENGTVVFISMSDIDQGTGLNSGYERKSFEAVKNGYTKFQKDAVLLAKITPCIENNKTALVTHESGGYATTEVYPIHAKEKLLPHYLLSFLRSSVPRELLINKMEGATGRQRVPTKAVKEIMVPVCSLNEQEKANKFISVMQEKTQSNKQVLRQKLQQLQQLKASLLDSAFRGEL